MKKKVLIIVSVIFLQINCFGQDSTASQIKDNTIAYCDKENNETHSKKNVFNWEFIFQLIAAVGSLSTFGAFVFLFCKDKSKQAQIDKLSNIATVLEAQYEMMYKQNDLVSQQVEIIRNISIGGENDKAIEELRAIEEKKLKLSVKPNLWLNGAGYDGSRGELRIDLNNKGEDAKLLEFNLDSEDIELHSKSLPYNLDKGAHRYIFGRSKGNKHIKDCRYEIIVVYADKLDNKYKTIISGVGADAKITEMQEINASTQ